MRTGSCENRSNLMVRRGLVSAVTLAVLLILAGSCASQSRAQTGGWAEPVRLFESFGWSLYPSIVADAGGNVHVVWCEAGPELATPCAAIYYAYFDGKSWSTPVDIVAASYGEIASAPVLGIDGAGTLHLTWLGGFTDRVMYSQAYAPLAGSARNWLEAEQVSAESGATAYPDIAVEETGAIHIVYAVQYGTQSGIYHVRSADGDVWTAPDAVFSNNADDRMVSEPRLAADPQGGLHVAWTEAGYPESFPPSGLRYSRSLDGGDTWHELGSWTGPYSLSGVLAPAAAEVHLVWSGTSEDRFKFHTWSVDRGTSWSTPTHTSEIGGQEGWPALAVDRAGDLHLLQVTGENGVPLTHQVWDAASWSPAVRLLGQLPGAPYHPWNADVTIGLGNQIHGVVSHAVEMPTGSDNWQYDIYYLRGTASNAPAVEPRPLPAPTSAPKTATPAAVASKVTPTPATTLVPGRTESGSVAGEGLAANAALIGALAGGAIVALVVTVSMLGRRRRR